MTGTVLIAVALLAVLEIAGRPGAMAEPRPCPPGGEARVDVLMLSTSWCGYCKAARGYLDERGIDWCELDIETSETGAARHAAVGGRGVPVFVAGNRVLHGFSKRGLAEWLAAAEGRATPGKD